MSTKAQQVLSPHSDWNQCPNDEPVFVLRAVNWKVALMVVALTKTDSLTSDDLLKTAMEMKKYHEDNDIPF